MSEQSNVKREGSRAFNVKRDPFLLNPFKEKSHDSEYELWMEGWKEAAIKHNEELKREANALIQWGDLRSFCPWVHGSTCKASDLTCNINNCAPWYFIQGTSNES